MAFKSPTEDAETNKCSLVTISDVTVRSLNLDMGITKFGKNLHGLNS